MDSLEASGRKEEGSGKVRRGIGSSDRKRAFCYAPRDIRWVQRFT
jgi:hypothetical protein